MSRLPALPLPRGVPTPPRLPSPAEVVGAARDLAAATSDVATALLPGADHGRRRRRAWHGEGRSAIEIRTATRADRPVDLRDALVEAVSAIDGVEWAELDGRTGRLVVDFDPVRIGPEAVVAAVESTEADLGVDGERFSHDRPEHPGDGESARGALLGLGTDVVAAGASVAGVGLSLLPIPIPAQLGALAGLVREQPRIRRELDELVGPVVADVGLGITNAVGAALTHGPLAVGVDALHRTNQWRAARSRRVGWDVHHERLIGGPDDLRAEALSAAGATLAATRSPTRATAMITAVMPRAARLGRESYVHRLQHALTERHVVVLDPGPLGLLDAVDCVVVTEQLVVTGRWRIDRVALTEDADRSEVNRQLRRLHHPDRPSASHHRGDWSAGPLDELGEGVAESAVDLPYGTHATHALCERGRLVAAYSLLAETSPAAARLVDAALDAEHLVALAGDDDVLARRLGAQILVQPGPALVHGVRQLQEEGHVVAVVADSGDLALASADIGVAVASDGPTPWGADLVCPDVASAGFLVGAAGVAHQVSRQSAALNLTGSAIGGVAALTAPLRVAGRRAGRAVDIAGFAAVLNAMRAARSLDSRIAGIGAAPPMWHELGREAVLEELESDRSGLDDAEAARRRSARRRRPPAPVELARAIWDETFTPLTPVLAGGALLSASVGGAVDAGLVGSVAALNSVISGVQRFGAERAVRRLASDGEVAASVRRDGHVVRRDAHELVPGDIVLLAAGDTVPVDCRVLSAAGVEVDEAMLTGESRPITKSVEASFGAELGDRTCMLFSGTTVVAGSAVAVAVAEASDSTGEQFDRTASAGGVEAHLRELSSLSLPVAGASGALLAAGELLRGGAMPAALSSGVSLAVAAVPEGLPMLATLGQLAAARRLSDRAVLVRNPRAVEALGRAEVLCVDKTGTLTAGRVTVNSISDGVAAVAHRGGTPGERPTGDQDPPDGDPSAPIGDAAGRVVEVAARATPSADGERGLAHLTDRAVVEVAAECGADGDLHRWRRDAELAFGPDHPYHAVWGRLGGRRSVSVKGAPEFVVGRCDRWAPWSGRAVALTDERRGALEAHVDELTARGLRVLAVAERRYRSASEAPAAPTDDDVEGLTLVGFLGLADPVRPTAAAAVAGLQEAGVDVVMVTGDHPGTAKGIASELGLLNGGRVLTGAELEDCSDAELADLLDDVTVFARVTPRQKMRIVAAYQRAGRPVAMTGDGANDASAIRAADVGIALGVHCTPAARDAADVIILDERIETLVEAIIEGRALWASMRDALSILLGGNLGEIAFLLVTGAIGGRPSLNVRQVLLVNLLTDVAPSLAIAARPPSGLTPAELAAEGPERSLGWSLNRDIVTRAATTSAGATAAWSLARATGTARRASTVGLLALVGTQLGQTLSTGRGDPVVTAAGVGSALVLAGIVQTPGVSQFFGCTPVGPVGWGIATGCSTAATIGAPWLGPVVEATVGRVPMARDALGHPASLTVDESSTGPGGMSEIHPPDTDDEPTGAEVIDLATRLAGADVDASFLRPI